MQSSNFPSLVAGRSPTPRGGDGGEDGQEMKGLLSNDTILSMAPILYQHDTSYVLCNTTLLLAHHFVNCFVYSFASFIPLLRSSQLRQFALENYPQNSWNVKDATQLRQVERLAVGK